MPRKILAIDDSLTLRQFIQRSLSQHSGDYAITTAKDGTEGVSFAQRDLPELILLDYVLPDMKGDEVCRRLASDPATAKIPIVLMSSSLEEIKRTEGEYATVLKSIAKPFSPELLCATVGYAFREITQRAAGIDRPAPPTPAASTRAAGRLFTGHTGLTPLLDPLLGLEQEALTGVLRLSIGEKNIEFYVLEGKPQICTCRDSQAYLNASSPAFTPEQQRIQEVVFRGQKDCGCPVFLSFAERGVMSSEESLSLVHTHGLQLFAQVWTAPRVNFEFESRTIPPDFALRLAPYPNSMVEWLMESCRLIGTESQYAMAWGDFSGIPAYTRRGYERIQQIPLIDEEVALAEKVNSSSSLTEIAQQMSVPVETAQAILYRFLCLQIYEYWPASILRPT
jgi:CheY-like chemotaxis protein